MDSGTLNLPQIILSIVWASHLLIPILGILLWGIRSERRLIAAERLRIQKTLLIAARGRRAFH
jgi:hypothetical protein